MRTKGHHAVKVQCLGHSKHQTKCLLLTVDTNLLSGTVIGTEDIRTNKNLPSPAKMAR